MQALAAFGAPRSEITESDFAPPRRGLRDGHASRPDLQGGRMRRVVISVYYRADNHRQAR